MPRLVEVLLDRDPGLDGEPSPRGRIRLCSWCAEDQDESFHIDICLALVRGDPGCEERIVK